MNEADQDFEVTFVLVDGRRIATTVEADYLRKMVQNRAIPPGNGDTRPELASMLLSILASGFENDNPWTANSTDGTTHLFRPGALLPSRSRTRPCQRTRARWGSHRRGHDRTARVTFGPSGWSPPARLRGRPARRIPRTPGRFLACRTFRLDRRGRRSLTR